MTNYQLQPHTNISADNADDIHDSSSYKTPYFHNKDCSVGKMRNNNPKLMLKKIMSNNVAQDDSKLMAMALSPRGNRMPGKICKNHDKSLINLSKRQ